MNKDKKQLGIYIHIPFCISKCVYCDFLSGPADENTKERYIHALCKEIQETCTKTYADEKDPVEQGKQSFGDYEVKSVFFGGGTPSAIEPEYINQVISELYRHFSIAKDAEISIECNPGTLTLKKAKVYKKAGINRISFGLQSADDQELKMLGRIHTFEQFLESFKTARQVGIDNVNVDIMSALPGQTLVGYERTLDQVISCAPEHISAYSLILEESTPLYKKYEKDYPPVPDEDTEREMYYLTERKLEAAGYLHYEISNYAKAGRECRHNLSYWERKDYLGFGIGAASLFEECRFSNIGQLEEYIGHTHLKQIRTDMHVLSVAEQMEEFMFLGLRKMNGIRATEFAELFGKDIEAVYGKVINKYKELGMIKQTGDCISLTNTGIDVSNVILSEFLLDES